MLANRARHGSLSGRRQLVVFLAGILLLAGCQLPLFPRRFLKRIPPPQPHSIEELYAEAVSSVKPENSLGMDHSRSPEPGIIVDPTHPGAVPHGGQPPLLAPPAGTLPVAPPPPSIPAESSSTNQPSTGVVPVSAAGNPEKLVNDIFTETDIAQAVQSLATQAGVSVVLDNTVRGSVNCTIENESFEHALQKILLPLGLVYRKKDGMYLVGSTEPTSNLFPHIAESIEYKPHHLSAQELVALLPSRQTQFVRMVEKRNLIIIEAPHSTGQQIYAQLEAADQPIPQIMIEALICSIAPEKGIQFGIDWNHGLQVQGVDRLNFGLSGLSFTGAVSPYGAGHAFDDFAVTSAFVKLLAREGYVTIKAAPRVMAKDGEKAEISIARDTFFSIQSGNSQFLFNQNIQKVESGISLNLTPSIRGDTVQIQIEKAEVSEDLRTTDANQLLINNPYPIINRRKVATMVQVRDRQTIVIGGLTQRQIVDRETKIPCLGNLPLIGGLFRKIEKQETETEVAIFISPTIVVPTAEQPGEVIDLRAPISPTTPPPVSPIPAAAPETPPAEIPAPAPPTVTDAAGAVVPQLRVVPEQ